MKKMQTDHEKTQKGIECITKELTMCRREIYKFSELQTELENVLKILTKTQQDICKSGRHIWKQSKTWYGETDRWDWCLECKICAKRRWMPTGKEKKTIYYEAY